MANVPHSGLTGSDLHESKGTAAAAANTVFIADGAGSGAYAKLPATAISGLANPFGAQLLHLRNVQASGTQPETVGITATTRVFNTVQTNEITSATLSSNQITLPIGTYFIDARLPVYLNDVGGTTHAGVSFLYNTTTAAELLRGCSQFIVFNVAQPSRETSDTFVKGRFTLSGTAVLEVRSILSRSGSGGIAASLGSEIYSEVFVWKVS